MTEPKRKVCGLLSTRPHEFEPAIAEPAPALSVAWLVERAERAEADAASEYAYRMKTLRRADALEKRAEAAEAGMKENGDLMGRHYEDAVAWKARAEKAEAWARAWKKTARRERDTRISYEWRLGTLDKDQ